MVEETNSKLINTELGIRPSDWLSTPVSEFIIEFRGGAPLTPSDFKKIGFKVLPKVGVIRGGNLLIEKEKQQYCNLEYADSHKSNIVDNNYTIIVLRDLVPSGPNIGLMVRINSNEVYLLAQGVYGFKVKDNVSSDFLIHVSNTKEYRRVMKSIMVGSTQVHITNGTFKQVKIPLPPKKAEQTAIATALNDADTLIHQLEHLLTKKRNIKNGAMQELLKPKEGWEEKQLGEVVDINMGQSPDSKNYNSNQVGLPLLQGNADLENRKQLIRFWTSQTTKTCDADDLILTVRAPVGSIGVAIQKSCIGRGVCSLKPKSVSKDFIYHLLIFKEKDWRVLEQGSTFTSANSNQIYRFEISIPKTETEQTNIAQILSDMDNEIQELERKLEKYRLLKQGMMQSLLTGKIRLV